MDLGTANYIITHFSSLLTTQEKLALRHTQSLQKLEGDENEARIKAYYERGWLTKDQAVLDLLKNGYEAFDIKVAKRILIQNPEKVFLNYCPDCNRLARTPLAKQCRYCGKSWCDL